MRPEKASIVTDLSEKLNRSPFVLVTDYQHMNVNHFADLRTRLAKNGAEVHVVKNSFLKRAMTNSGLPDVGDKLTGQTAVVTGEKDAAPIAKILKTFAAEFKIAALKIGIIDKAILSTQEVEVLAELPSREVLLSQFLGVLLAPATKLVRVLNEPASAFARLMKAKADAMPKAEAKPEAPKAEAPKAEAPKEEAPAAPATEAPSADVSSAEPPVAEAAKAESSAPAAAPAAAVEEKPTAAAEEKPAVAEPGKEAPPTTEGAA
jgi:large subunit ribosomal protein L10